MKTRNVLWICVICAAASLFLRWMNWISSDFLALVLIVLLFAADFLGSSNLFDGNITANGFETATGTLPLPQDRDAAPASGAAVLMVRPEGLFAPAEARKI